MKQLMILGGLAGFLIGLGFGWLNQSPWPSVLWRALVVTYLAALLMRWWGQVWVQGLRQSQQAATTAAERAEAAASPQPSPAPAK